MTSCCRLCRMMRPLVRALKEERLRVEFNERIDANPQEALEEYIRLKRQKKTRPGDGGGEE